MGRFRRNKGAIKLHTLLDLRGNIPCFVLITDGKTSDVTVLDKLVIEPGAFYVKDRGYIDFARLHRFTRNMAFFVTLRQRNMDYSRRRHPPVDKATGSRSRPNDDIRHRSQDVESLPCSSLCQLLRSRNREKVCFSEQ